MGNYSVAWSTLCKRFDNKKKLLNDHVRALFNFEPIQKGSCDKLQHLADNIAKHLGAIQQLDQSIENWDYLLIFWFSTKIDNASLCDWERQTRNNTESQTIDEFLNFLRERANFVDSLDYKCNQMRDNKPGNKLNKETSRYSKKETVRVLSSGVYTCNYCKGNHSIYSCHEFLNIGVNDRIHFIKKNSAICPNCLRTGHSVYKCKMGPCKKCKGRHNSLLHTEEAKTQQSVTETDGREGEIATGLSLSSGVISSSVDTVLLSTACVLVADRENKYHELRALLDCGSQTSFITERAQRKLNLPIVPTNLAVFGIANNLSSIKTKCEVNIKSRFNSFTANISCYILPEITGYLPNISLGSLNLNIPSGITLADSEFSIPGKVDLLIGADLFWQVLCSNKINLGKNLPSLQETHFGWVVSGQVGSPNPSKVSSNVSSNTELLQTLTRFWEIEEISTSDNRGFSEDELLCEEIYQRKTYRNEDGRFVVNMPLKQSPSCLGESKLQAENRFYALERRLLKNTKLYTMYRDFMKEYIDLNHMTLVKPDGVSRELYYTPHHGVLNEASQTTKLRVVFNASAPTTSGLSLNNIQLIGPVLQQDLLSIILRFREYTYAISADISKMYRQVSINPLHRNLQRILWRASPSEPLETYELNTVTYGQASASYLAIKCLFVLAEQIQTSMPDIARIIREEFYVDDLLSGADSLEQAQKIVREVASVVETGCFELRKWCSNNSQILEGVEKSKLAFDTLKFSKDNRTKTLGLTWSCQADCLAYNINIDVSNQKISKRTILSTVSKIFDPLGLLSPCSIIVKMLLQKLWSDKLSWDDPVPDSIKIIWDEFCQELPILNKLSIPRHVVMLDAVAVDLHGFSDASERAYGACLYVRSVTQRGLVQVRLLCAKSKVAPIKTVAIPRLELCAALLLSRLTHKVINSMKKEFQSIFLWTDSTITLAWIKTSPNLLKTFTANRVSEIKTLTETFEWKHVPTKENPADIVSRGLRPSLVKNSRLWWNGPSWLALDSSHWPNSYQSIEDLPELKASSLVNCIKINLNFPFERYSSLSHICKVTAYIFRFKHNCLHSKGKLIGCLSPQELTFATNVLVKISQNQSFNSEINNLRYNKSSKVKSKLAGLTPFIDSEHILRVGGRLRHDKLRF